MVDEGLPVIEVTGDGGGLEDLFLRVTGRVLAPLPEPPTLDSGEEDTE